MLKNIYKKIIVGFFIFVGFYSTTNTFLNANIRINLGGGGGTSEAPDIQCKGLPGCGIGEPKNFLVSAIDLFIKIVIVLAVFALIFSGIMYMISAGEEEKANRAKKWIVWSLIGVFLSSSAWGIIFLLNNIKF